MTQDVVPSDKKVRLCTFPESNLMVKGEMVGHLQNSPFFMGLMYGWYVLFYSNDRKNGPNYSEKSEIKSTLAT